MIGDDHGMIENVVLEEENSFVDHDEWKDNTLMNHDLVLFAIEHDQLSN